MRALLFVFVTASIFGLADSAYLTYVHYFGPTLGCTILEGCNTVASSSYAQFLGIPLSLFGVLYYGTMILFVTIYMHAKNLIMLPVIMLFTSTGMILSLYFLYLQVFVIHALCAYCIASLITSSIIFLISLIFFFYAYLPSKSSVLRGGEKI